MDKAREETGTARYFNLYKKLKERIGGEDLSGLKELKIAILSSFTVKGMEEILFVKCRELGISPKFYMGGYRQCFQEILDDDSGLYKFDPDLVIIFMDIMSILGDRYFLPYHTPDEQRKGIIDDKLKEIRQSIQKIKNRLSSKVLMHNFEVPSYSPLGIVENKQSFGFIESVEVLNNGLRESFKTDPQVFIFDYNSFCSKIGKQNIMDYKMYYLGDMKIDFKYMPRLCDEYLSYIKPLSSRVKKCIVLDLDNTLWGGIVGEDGLNGIKIGPSPDGRPFLEFQKYLLSLFNRGVILAINSNNNPGDVSRVFREHPDMVLKEEHFAAQQVNWDDKISNMKRIAAGLNISMDSLVFIDDNKFNREMIKSSLPDVLVIDLPEDRSLYLKTIMEVNDFNTLHISEEDKGRGRIYAEQRKRDEYRKVETDITEYLKGLQTVVTIEKADSFNIPRISQLTQKTNQFNMTTKRYTEEEIRSLSLNNNILAICARIEDRFGDNGIAGAAIVEKGRESWIIDNLLLSCRVIGRRIEETLLAYIIKYARKEKAISLAGVFIPTKKNAPAKDFFKNNGFGLVDKNERRETWEYDMKNEYRFHDFIKIIER